MRSSVLIARSLRHYRRTHLGVCAGAAVATAVLVGALLVGDSVRSSLRTLALLRLGDTRVAMASGDRFFRAALAEAVGRELGAPAAAAIMLPGTAARSDASARADRVQVLGVDDRFWRIGGRRGPPASGDEQAVTVNEHLARRLGVALGDEILLRLKNPSGLSRDAPLSRDADAAVSVRLIVRAIVGDGQFGRFALEANQLAPLSAFVPLERLQRLVKQPGRANLMLLGGPEGLSVEAAEAALRKHWRLADAQLELRELPSGWGIELRSGRIFLDDTVADAAAQAAPNATGVLSYFVNEIKAGERATPYSMVAAIGPLTGRHPPAGSIVPADMRDDEIVINDWLADDLGVGPGDKLRLTYYVLGPMRRLSTRTEGFTVRAVAPLWGRAADPTLMPDFPGLAGSERCRDWRPGVPLDLAKVRDKDEAYWRDHRGTPKAFVTLAAGRRMWANRFGSLTAVRFDEGAGPPRELADRLRARLSPAAMGLFFRAVRRQALLAGEQAIDFGQLFLGLSFFLIAAGILLMGLLFVLGIQQRTDEVGTLLALGFSPGRVRRLMLAEGGVLAVVGAAVGAAAGVLYTRATLWALASVWREAVAGSAITYHGRPGTILWGSLAAGVIALAAMWAALRAQARRPARELLAGEAAGGSNVPAPKTARRAPALWLGLISLAAAAVLVVLARPRQDRPAAGAFFAAGALVLIGEIAISGAILAAIARAQGPRLTLARLAARNTARRRGRSLAVVFLLAAGSFLVISVGAFRLGPPTEPRNRSAGTGGFALYGVSALPIFRDLNSPAGRDAYGLTAEQMRGVSVVAMRVRDGDDASCLNLNRAQRPRLLGVRPQELQSRGAFTFVAAEDLDGRDGAESPWALLGAKLPSGEVPAVGDKATVVWGLGKGLGRTISYTDDRGGKFKIRLVGVLANSILQGSLIVSEENFTRRFPSSAGYRALLIDAPPPRSGLVAAAMSRALRREGLALTPTGEQLAAFNAVQNTYLSIFQALGGLGLILGSVGMAVVVLRNVLARRAELALLRAVGFTRGRLEWMVLLEHWGLLVCGLACGLAAAMLAALPALRSPGTKVPWGMLWGLLAGAAATGAAWVYLATRMALRGRLLDALRNE